MGQAVASSIRMKAMNIPGDARTLVPHRVLVMLLENQRSEASSDADLPMAPGSQVSMLAPRHFSNNICTGTKRVVSQNQLRRYSSV
jgi:hypothetical protein